MNALGDDIRTVLHRQSDAMHVPTRPSIDDLTLTKVTTLPPHADRRWLLPAAAALLVAVGGLAIAQTTGEPNQTNSAEQPAATAFSFETPTVRLTAEQIEVLVGNEVSVPVATDVDSDPGNAEYTTLELIWNDGSKEQRLNVSFASDGTSWWASTISTYDANGEWIDSRAGQRWFTSPLGQAWTGDLDLPNVRISGMTIEAFLRPASCDNPTSPIAVIAAYPAIDGVAGTGFGGRIDLIDTSSCTAIDPTLYTFTATSADPTVAEVVDQSPVSPTTVVGDATAATQPSEAEMFGLFNLAFRSAGETTIQLTVTDSAGTIIGTVTTPVVVRPPDSSTDASPVTTAVQTGVESIPTGSVICVIAGASEHTARLCADELGGAIVTSTLTSADSFVMPVDPNTPDHLTATANVSNLLGVAVRTLDTSWLPTLATDQTQLTYLVLGTDEGPYAS